MIWNSAADFFAMGGYALYVWGSFGACALGLVIEPILLAKRRNDALHSVKRELLLKEKVR